MKSNVTMSGHTWTRFLPEVIRRRIEGRQNLLNIIANTVWLFADKIVRMGMGLLVGVWVARYLGPEQFGSLNYAAAFVALFSTLSFLGVESIVIRDIVNDPASANELLGSATLLKLLGALVAVAASVTTILFIRAGDSTSLILVVLIATGTIFQALDTIDFWFQSRLRAKFTVYARNTAFVVISVVKVILILSHASLVAFAAAALAEVAIGTMGLVWWYRRDGNFMSQWSISRAKMFYLLRESWPLCLQGIIILVYMRIDQVMLGQISGNRSVGEFSAAVRLVEVWYFIPMSLTASLFPEIINSRNMGKEIYEKRIQKLYDLMIWMAIGMALIITFAAPLIISILYGEQYRNAATVLSLQTWMAVSVFFGVARQRWLTAEGFLKDGLYFEITAVVINVSVNLYLIPLYGAVGASLASLAAAFGASIITALYSTPIRTSMKMFLVSLMLPFRLIKGYKAL